MMIISVITLIMFFAALAKCEFGLVLVALSITWGLYDIEKAIKSKR